MTDDKTPATPVVKDDTAKVADPDKTDSAGLDLTKITDEDFGKIFEDERLWKHERFKKLNLKAKKADELEQKLEAQRQQELEKNQEWQKLAEERQQKIEALQNQYNTEKLNNTIQAEATKQGAIDAETVLKLIDQSSIKVTENGVEGVSEAVSKLLEQKPFLAGKTNTSVGKGTNPVGEGEFAPKKFKASQLKDATFFRENEKEITKAISLNLIEDDLAE